MASEVNFTDKFGGVCWKKSGLILSKIPTNSLRPAAARFARCSAKKFSSHFLIWREISFSSKRKRKLFCGTLL